MNSIPGVCSNAYGTLEWAKKQCDNDISCNWLHDYGCDDKRWRFCSNIDIGDYKGTGGCTQIKPEKTGNFNKLYM